MCSHSPSFAGGPKTALPGSVVAELQHRHSAHLSRQVAVAGEEGAAAGAEGGGELEGIGRPDACCGAEAGCRPEVGEIEAHDA